MKDFLGKYFYYMSLIEGDPTKPDAQPPSPEGEKVRREHVLVYQAGAAPPPTSSPNVAPYVGAASPDGPKIGIEHTPKQETLWGHVQARILNPLTGIHYDPHFLEQLEAYCRLAEVRIRSVLTPEQRQEYEELTYRIGRIIGPKYDYIRGMVARTIEMFSQQRQPLQQPTG